MKAFVLFVGILFSISQTGKSQGADGLVKWLDFEEAMALNKENPRAIIIDFYTDWCGWCKRMIQTTYSNPNIAAYINTNFYPIKFDAERKDSISYNDTIYTNRGVGRRPTHDLAVELLGGRLTYPTTLFFNNNFQYKLIAPGYMDARTIEPLLVYSVENVYFTTNADDYRYYHNKSITDSLKIHDTIPVKWYSFPEALRESKLSSKKVLLFIYTDWCNSCKVMLNASLSHPIIADYINAHYCPVMLNAETKDTLFFQGQYFVNNPNDGHPFHQFVMSALQQRIVLPSMLFVSSSEQVISPAPWFMTSEYLEPVLSFFAGDHYLREKWDDYRNKHKGKVKRD